MGTAVVKQGKLLCGSWVYKRGSFMRKITVLIMGISVMAMTFQKGTSVAAGNEKTYVLQEGKSAHSRLKRQSDIYRPHLMQAFKTAAAIKGLSGLRIVDFGCGTSEIYADVMSFIGRSGNYIGTDRSADQISFAREKYPTAEYIVGDESNPQVLQSISKADIVYMRLVVMHQKQPAAFVKKIYEAMKPGAILIMQEVEDTPEQKEVMLKQYPNIDGVDKLYDYKKTLGPRVSVDYGIARYLKNIFAKLEPINLTENAEEVMLSMATDKPLLEEAMHEIESKCVPQGILSQEEVDAWLETIAKLPTGEDNFWSWGKYHTIIGQKPELS